MGRLLRISFLWVVDKWRWGVIQSSQERKVTTDDVEAREEKPRQTRSTISLPKTGPGGSRRSLTTGSCRSHAVIVKKAASQAR